MTLGVVLALCAALGFGSSAVFARLGLQYVRSTTGTLVSLMVGTAISLTIALIFYTDDILALSGVAFLWFLLVGVINFPIGRLLSYTGVGMAGVSRTAPIVGANPLFATILAVTIGGETVSATTLVGTLSIIGGLALILSQR